MTSPIMSLIITSLLLQGDKKGDGAAGDAVGSPAEEEMGQPEGEVQGQSSTSEFTHMINVRGIFTKELSCSLNSDILSCAGAEEPSRGDGELD